MISPSEWMQIRAMIAQTMDVILSGNTAATQVDGVVGTESINNLYPGLSTIEGRPVAHPYGLVSRAPVGTAQVTARQGDHPGNRIVLSHRDKNRPTLGADGEVMIYDAFGNQIYLKNGEILIGANATKKAARNGDSCKTTLTPGPTGTLVALLGLIAANMTSAGGPLSITNPSPPTGLDIQGSITAGSNTVKIVD